MKEYITHFDICALFISLVTLLIFMGKKDRHRIQNKVFFAFMIDEVVMTAADLASAILIKVPTTSETIRFWKDFSNYAYHLPHTLVPVLFTLYVFLMTGAYKKHKPSFIVTILAPYLLILGLQISNPFTSAIFYFDANDAYQHGPLMVAMYFMAVLYVLLAIYFIIRYRNSIPNNRIIPLLFFVIMSISAMAVQIFIPQALIECFVQVTMTLCLLVTIENPVELYSSETNVYNRKTFVIDNINMIRNNVPYRIILIKILNIDYYMTTLGFSSVSEILYEIAQWLMKITSDDTVYDCNNGIFALVLNTKLANRTDQIMSYLGNRFSTDWLYKGRILTLKTEICQVDVPTDISSIEEIVSLMESPGPKEDSRVIFLKKDHLNYIHRRRAVENAVDRALESNSFKVYFQPIWDAKSNKIHSAEALIRLIDDELGFISPEEFIPITEQNGKIIAIGQFVFEEVCRMFSLQQLKTIGLDFLEINLSTVQCMHKSLPKIFETTLGHYSLPPIAINLEITESAAINSQEDFKNTIKDLHDLGFTFSLDDYGTGYSNATYIFSMDFDIIKIDKSILWESEKSESARIVLQNTVKMIKELGKKILVEGVETKAQKDSMVALGVDYCQGYYFSRPVPQQEFIEFCKDFNSSH